MSSFQPFIAYEYLKAVVSSGTISMDLHDLNIDLSRLTGDASTIAQAIIYHHSLQMGRPEAIPYDGHLFTRTRGAKYDLKKLPDELKYILKALVESAGQI